MIFPDRRSRPSTEPFDDRLRLPAEQVDLLWSEYQVCGDSRLRDRIVVALLPMVKHIVYRKARAIPGHCDAEDLVSCGMEALLGAVDRYNPEKGATLEQYAWTRVHGAVLDELRRNDWAPRSVRRWERELGEVRDRFTRVYGRSPSDAELAQAAGISLAELRRLLGEVARSQIASLNTPVSSEEDAGDVEAIETVPSSDRSSDPEYTLMRKAEIESFRDAFRRLGPRERQLAMLLHVNEMSVHDASELLGISESRATEIHRQIKATLRRDAGLEAERAAL